MTREFVISNVVGYAYSILVGWALTAFILRRLWAKVLESPKEKPPDWAQRSALVGIFERCAYTASWQLGKPEFIGAWLVLKAVVRWSDRSSYEKVYNIFLIGNALSILFAVTGAKLIQWVGREPRSLDHAVLVGIVLPVATILAYGLSALLCRETKGNTTTAK